MHEHEPPRLKDAEGTSDALNRALSALRKGPDDAARLARVSKQLEAYLDATPPAASVRPLRPTLPVLKLVAGGALLVAPLLWLAYARFAAEEVPPSAAVTAPAAQSMPPTAAAPEPVAQPARGEVDEVARPQAQPAHGKPSRRAAHAERRTGKPARASEPSQGTEHAFERGESSASSGEPTASPVLPPATPEPAQAKQPEPQPQPTREPVPAEQRKLASRTPSESELLFDARKALPGDAQLALRLLTEHAAHYPKGQLVPEREVLAIEALRKLGRTQEADTRLQRFQEKYPHSLHLQRLQR